MGLMSAWQQQRVGDGIEHRTAVLGQVQAECIEDEIDKHTKFLELITDPIWQSDLK